MFLVIVNDVFNCLEMNYKYFQLFKFVLGRTFNFAKHERAYIQNIWVNMNIKLEDFYIQSNLSIYTWIQTAEGTPT